MNRRLAAWLGAALAFAACAHQTAMEPTGRTVPAQPLPSTDPQLPAERTGADYDVRWGRLADVYGYRGREGRQLLWAHQRDVLIAPTLPQVLGVRVVRLPCNPDSLQPRVLIDADVDSAEFGRAFAALQASPSELGSELPLDAVLRVRWRGDRVPSAGFPRLVPAPDASRPPASRIVREHEVLLTPFAGNQSQARERLQIDVSAEDRTFVAGARMADPEPLFLIGEFVGALETALVREDGTMMLTLRFERPHARIGAGDVVRVDLPKARRVSLDVLAEARAAEGADRMHVLARAPQDATAVQELAGVAAVRRAAGPAAPALRATLVARCDPAAGDVAAAFVRIDRGDGLGAPVDPTAIGSQVGFTLRFSAPIEPRSLGMDGGVHLHSERPVAELPLRVFAVDAAGTTFRFTPPLGVLCTPELRREAEQDRELAPAARRAHYRLRLLAGESGPKSIGGGTIVNPVDLPLTLASDASDNIVSSVVRRLGD